MRATPGPGYLLSTWTGTAGEILSSNLTASFVMKSNLVLTANFLPNPILPAVGSYRGLFFDTDLVEQASAGCFSATVRSDGSFSGLFQQGPTTWPISGKFSLGGVWSTNSIKGWPGTHASLQLDLAGGGSITGTVSTVRWRAQLLAYQAFDARQQPAPQAGKYTLVLPGSANASAEPGGDGYGKIVVQTNGSLSLDVTLGDGTRILEVGTLSSAAQWPVYAPLYAGKGSIFGWLAFTNAADRDIEGVLNWTKPARSAGSLYPPGFTNQVEAIGSLYVFTNGAPALAMTDGALILEGGSLPGSLANGITLLNSDVALGLGGVRVTINSGTGLFQGSLTNPWTGRPIQISGAVLQKLNAGYGLFLGASQSGSVFFGPLSTGRPSSPTHGTLIITNETLISDSEASPGEAGGAVPTQ